LTCVVHDVGHIANESTTLKTLVPTETALLLYSQFFELLREVQAADLLGELHKAELDFGVAVFKGIGRREGLVTIFVHNVVAAYLRLMF
jgi:hypothetical protein